ncbi:MAG: pyridoxamine 5'-phosphate oxidase family protein [Pseudomonadota bacterium]
MTHAYHDLAFTPRARALQTQHGSRSTYARAEGGPVTGERIGPDEAAFIATRDSVYIASVSETGWPYVQHRGGPTGFLRVLDERRLGFADFTGNRQYITLANTAHDDRVSLFLMDYARRGRLKIMGHMRPLDPADTATLAALAVPDYRARVERGMVIEVAGLDWNCPQHITPRFTEAEVREAIQPLHQRIADLEARLAAARAPGDSGDGG